MADCTLLLTHYCDENYPLVKQLKPFRFYDDASLEKILKSAFTKLKSEYMQYYVNKAEASNGNARFLALINMRNASKDGKDDAFKIYRAEMQLILLQDPAFVKDHFHELQVVIQEGWNGLSETQRLDFYERAVLSTEDDEQHNATVDSSLVTRESIHYEHDDMFLTNEIDNYAFDGYVDAKRNQNCLLDTNTLWKQWKEIPDLEREIYYCSGYFTSLPTAKKLFIKEKETIKFDPERTAEQKQLSKAWNDLAGTIQDAYVMRAFKKNFQRHQNHKMLFIRKFNNNRHTSATTYTDMDSRLEFLHPFTSIHNDSEESAFIVYMKKMRPDMLKQPGMAQKRYWEVSLILKDQWNALSKEKQQPYYDTVRCYLEIRRNLYAWKLEAKEVYGQGDAAFRKLDAETKKKFEDIALQNRKVLLRMYPDLHEYAQWVKRCYYKTDSKAVASSETKKTDTVESDVKIITQKSDKPPRVYQYCDSLDIMAFDTYKKTVRSMTSEYIEHEAYWPTFLNISDEQLNVYYAEAIKSKSLIRARALFAKDYGHFVRKPQKDEAFINELTKVHCTWESLSTPAKQFYIDIAKNNLLECQKKKVFDVQFIDESHYEFKDEYGSLWGDLHPKCDYYGGITDEESAIKLYQVNHLKDLLKEPGMANKRQFQLAGIMQQRFMNLSDEERQPYFDIVQRVKEIRAHLNVCSVEGYKIYSKNFGTSRKWEDASAEEKAVCEEVRKQNRATLLQKYPDVATYFHWVVNDHKNDKSRSDNTITFVQKESTVQNTPTAQAQNTVTAATEEPSVTNKTTEQASTKSGSSGTSETVIDDINIQKGEETTSVTSTDSTTAIVSDAVSKEDDSLELRSVDATVAEDTSEMSKSEDTREVDKEANVDQKELEFTTTGHATEKNESVTAEKITTESVKAKCEDISKNKPQTSANSVNTKKTPTAFMFYKKAMRRLNADQNFGKKDNESQRKALIAGWKKLSNEEKAVYFEKELLASL